VTDPLDFDPNVKPRTPSSAVLVVWLMGIGTGVFGALIVRKLSPNPSEADVAQYRAVRNFAQASFVRELSDQEILDRAMEGFTRSLDDYSRYYDADSAAELDRETAGRYAGLGALFSLIDGERRVLFPLPESPAKRAGLWIGDSVLEVDGESVAGLDDQTFHDLLQSRPGEVRELHLRSLEGVERTVEITPESLLDPSIRQFHMVDAERGLAYLSIHSFSRETAREFDAAWAYLEHEGATSLVIDLRGNLGGVLDAAVAIARRFIPSGVIVSTEGRLEVEIERGIEGHATLQGLPLVVLVDEHSASASEVLAGALQDHRVAVLVGAPTFGKGMVQTIRRFPDSGTRAKITSAHYYSPSHRNFERSSEGRDYGIRPDVEVEITEREKATARTHSARYGPPVEARADLAAWEAELGETLVEPLPDDAQLRAAFLLLAGKRPTALALYTAPAKGQAE
jgi:carboxyl-terminal processing protease